MTKKSSLNFIFSTFLFASVLAGQAIKLNIKDSPRISLLLLDVVIILFVAIFIITVTYKNKVYRFWRFYLQKIKDSKIWLLANIFILWALISFIISSHRYTISQDLAASSYLLRLFLVGIFSFIVYFLIKNEYIEGKYVRDKFIFWAFIAVLAGFIQLIILPDFSFMTYSGWDPHQNRLLSTFFDPNYFGVFIVLLMSVVSFRITKKIYWPIIVIFSLSWAALYLTFSRSAWLAGAIALPIAFWYKSWKISLLVLAIFIALALVPSRLNDRIAQSRSFFSRDLFSSQAKDLDQIDLKDRDPSASARTISLKKGWEIAKRNWLIGAGYNFYGYELKNLNLSKENDSNGLSGQGSDSSLLNIFATTGIIGLAIFIWLIALVLIKLWKLWRNTQPGGGLLGFLVAYLIASFFNNSLFYMLILIPFLVLIISLEDKSKKKVTV